MNEKHDFLSQQPQKDEENQGVRRVRQLESCLVCGKPAVSIHKGVCFYCREKNATYESDEQKGFDKYLDWVETKSEMSVKWWCGLIFRPLSKYGFAVLWFDFAVLLLIILLGMVLSGNLTNAPAITMIIFCLLITSILAGIFNIVYVNKHRITKYNQYCLMKVVDYGDRGWTCPCCKEQVLYKKECNNCGVAPQLEKAKSK